MIELPWIDHFPDNNLQNSFEMLEKVYWPIQVLQFEGEWRVYTGEVLIFRTDNQESLEAFLYGLGVTYVSFPQEIIDAFHEECRKLVE